ncbi:MAG: YfjI family protein [Henriciella sp.]
MPDQEPRPFEAEELQPIIFESGVREVFPVHALGPLRPAVEYIQMRTSAPIEIAAQSVLSVTSSVTQGFANVDKGLLGGVSPLSLFMITIAESGERKSACDSLARKPLDEFERQYHQIFQDAHRRWKVRHADWEQRFEQYENRLNANRDDNEEDEQEAPVEPLPPMSPQRYSTEPTIEGLIQMLRHSHPAQAILSDEGGQLLGGFSMSADQAKKSYGWLNSFWSGDPIKRVRVGDGVYVLFGRRLAMHLMVQKGVALDLFADPKSKDMGFLARCLMVEPASRIGHRPALRELPDDAAYQAFCLRIARLLGEDIDYHNGHAPEDGRICPHSGALRLPDLRLSQEAADALRAYYNEVEGEQLPRRSYEDVRSFASKSAEQAARIAGILTIYENEVAEIIGANEMRCGIDLARFYLTEARRLMDRAPAEKLHRDAQKLSDWLSERSDEFSRFTPSMVQRQGPSPCRNKPYLGKVLKTLEEFGHITKLDPGTEIHGVARSIGYALHPALQEAPKA